MSPSHHHHQPFRFGSRPHRVPYFSIHLKDLGLASRLDSTSPTVLPRICLLLSHYTHPAPWDYTKATSTPRPVKVVHCFVSTPSSLQYQLAKFVVIDAGCLESSQKLHLAQVTLQNSSHSHYFTYNRSDYVSSQDPSCFPPRYQVEFIDYLASSRQVAPPPPLVHVYIPARSYWSTRTTPNHLNFLPDSKEQSSPASDHT